MTSDKFQDHVIDSLARLETNMKSLVGNGQPGRVSLIETEVSDLKKVRWFIAGALLAAMSIADAFVHYMFK